MRFRSAASLLATLAMTLAGTLSVLGFTATPSAAGEVAEVAWVPPCDPLVSSVQWCPPDPCLLNPKECDPPPPPPPPPPAPAYRLDGQIYKIGSDGCTGCPSATVRMRGWSRFENSAGVKVDADYLSISCSGGGSSDSDDEEDAGFTDVEFNIGPAPVGIVYLVTCYHLARFQGVTYTKTSSVQVQIF